MSSKAFNKMLNQFNTIGTTYKDGYDDDLLKNIPKEERKEAEEIILKKFQTDSRMLPFIKQFQYYDSDKIIKQKLEQYECSSIQYLDLFFDYYGFLYNKKIKNIIYKLYKNKREDRIHITEKYLSNMDPSYNLFCFLKNLLTILDEDEQSTDIEKTSLLQCFLYCTGILKSTNNLQEYFEIFISQKNLFSKDKDIRNIEIKKLEEDYKKIIISRRYKL